MTPEEKLEAAVRHIGGTKDESSLQSLAAAARAELASHPKARPWWSDGVVLLGLNLVMGLAGAALMSWNDDQHLSSFSKYAVATAWFTFMGVGSVVWLKPAPVGTRLAMLGVFGGASILTLAGLSGFDPGGPFWSGMRCAFTECAVAAVPVLVVVALSRRFAAQPLHVLVGALTAGAGGTVALHFHCSNGTWQHFLTFHLAPALVLATLAALTRRMLAPASHAP